MGAEQGEYRDGDAEHRGGARGRRKERDGGAGERRDRHTSILVHERSLCQRSFANIGFVAGERVDRRRARGSQTRGEILDRAAAVASVEGVTAVTIGALAADVGLSKSGLIRHFGSKERLQIATISHAAALFNDRVLAAAGEAPPGLGRLRAVVDAWLNYLVGDAFPGGCFFYAAGPELDRQPGPVRDALFATVAAGLSVLREDLEAARADGDLDERADLGQLLFELHGHLQQVSAWHLLLEDSSARSRGAAAIEALLERHAPAHRRRHHRA